MKNVIVTTTINPPTDAVRRFDAMKDWHLIVVGDRKTPVGYKLDRGEYLSPDDQDRIDGALSEVIGWNTIQRRNFGFLLAAKHGAEIIATVDDDNNPQPGWGQNLMIGRPTEVAFYEVDQPAFDPVGATNHAELWHRGFPIQLLAKRDYSRRSRAVITPDVQADFWNGDPDIDAICRMEHAPECDFDRAAFPLTSNRLAPFNSQNTFLKSDLLPDYFMCPEIGRMDDIWAAYYVQAKGARVVYGAPSVYHERNVHDLTRDMKLEYLGYENCLSVVNSLTMDAESLRRYLPGRAIWAWDLYRRHFR